MTITEIPSEDLEGQLLEHIEKSMNPLDPDATWMAAAIKELRLRRLARSAG